MTSTQHYATAVNKLTVKDSAYADVFQGIMPAVETLYVRSDNLDDLLTRPRVAIVGSRKLTTYGKQVTAELAGGLARQGIVIISGLAYGVDAVAHQAALDAGGLTIAVLPSSIERVYPRANVRLADHIVEQGGALISEYPAGSEIAWKNQFVERNRIVCGMSNALLITEAAVNSGTMHTARFALDQGRDVLAVPGNITSPLSEGTNNLLRKGAVPITNVNDVLQVLSLKPLAERQIPKASSAYEQLIIDLMVDGVRDGDALLEKSQLDVTTFNQVLTMLELTGKASAIGANQWILRT